MNSQCEKIEPLIVDHVLGELERSRSESVQRHLISCARCSQALEEVREIVSNLSQHEMVEPSAVLSASVRHAVREKVLARRSAVSVVTALAGSFFRRPLYAGASALIAIAAATLLLVLSGPPGQKEPSGNEGAGRRMVVLKSFGEYLRQSQRFLELAPEAGAAEAFSVYQRDDWKRIIGQAMDMQKDDGLAEYQSLLADLETFYRKLMSCHGKFGEKELAEIRELMDKAMLKERVAEAIRLWK
jgi:hypothetical protein